MQTVTIACGYAERHYADCRYAECRTLFTVMLHVIHYTELCYAECH